MFQAVPPATTKDLPLVLGRAEHVAPVMPVSILRHVHPVGVKEHVAGSRIAAPVPPGLEAAVEMVVATRTNPRRSRRPVAIRPSDGCQPAAHVVEVALVVVFGKADIAAKVDSIIALGAKPAACPHTRPTHGPPWPVR